MRFYRHFYPSAAKGYVLLLVMVMLTISLIIAVGLFTYSNHQVQLNHRNNEYFGALAAAEAATEKVLSQVTSDFRDYGSGYVLIRLDNYRSMTPSPSEASVWADFRFMDLSRHPGRVEVEYASIPGYSQLGGSYGPLKAFKDRMRVLANAQPKHTRDYVVGSVYQDIELARIPIFQFAIFYNIELEFTPMPPMMVSGPVHCNTNIYMNPYGTLTFNSDVTSSGTIVEGPIPGGPFPDLGGTTIYVPPTKHDSGVSTLSLPIGTNNSPAAVRQVLDVPPNSEDPNSSLGRERYYNKADLIVTVSNSAVSVKSGRWDNFVTTLSSNAVFTIVSTNTSFYNKREDKTVRAINIDVANLVQWNATNSNIRPYAPFRDVRTIYVVDRRTLTSGNQSGVRVINGTNLPPKGLTVVTPSPFYVQGDYNAPPSARGSTNTADTLPSSFAADAITVLSTTWRDTNSTKSLTSRIAGDTTVNAAFLTGIVKTTSASDSGGVENFPRFLEEWTGKTLTYNGSMVAMFYSQAATGLWKGIGTTYDIYNPPHRNWALDSNYQYGDKLPPATPSLMVLIRASWRISGAFGTNVMAGF